MKFEIEVSHKYEATTGDVPAVLWVVTMRLDGQEMSEVDDADIGVAFVKAYLLAVQARAEEAEERLKEIEKAYAERKGKQDEELD